MKKYKIISLSFYHEDDDRLNELVKELRLRDGYPWTRSELARFLVRAAELGNIPARGSR